MTLPQSPKFLGAYNPHNLSQYYDLCLYARIWGVFDPPTRIMLPKILHSSEPFIPCTHPELLLSCLYFMFIIYICFFQQWKDKIHFLLSN